MLDVRLKSWKALVIFQQSLEYPFPSVPDCPISKRSCLSLGHADELWAPSVLMVCLCIFLKVLGMWKATVTTVATTVPITFRSMREFTVEVSVEVNYNELLFQARELQLGKQEWCSTRLVSILLQISGQAQRLAQICTQVVMAD